MRCDEIQERFVDLLYNESGTPPASAELRAHILSCPDCREELKGLKGVQELLRTLEDEPPIRPFVVPGTAIPARREFIPSLTRAARYAAIAAMVVITFLALANADLTWNQNGFSFRTRLWSSGDTRTDYYTKAEVRDLLKRVLDDSEARLSEANYLMMQRVLDTLEQDRWTDLRLVKHESRGKN